MWICRPLTNSGATRRCRYTAGWDTGPPIWYHWRSYRENGKLKVTLRRLLSVVVLRPPILSLRSINNVVEGRLRDLDRCMERGSGVWGSPSGEISRNLGPWQGGGTGELTSPSWLRTTTIEEQQGIWNDCGSIY